MSKKIQAIFFDLDSTLYNNRQYYLGAFKEVSHYLTKKYGIEERVIYQRLWKLWKNKTSSYKFLFNDLLASFKINDRRAINEVVKIFNGYAKEMKPYPDVIPVLKKLKERGYLLGIITDGNVRRQKRKIKLLGLAKFFKIVLYTKEIIAKPSPQPFLKARQLSKTKPETICYIGDNPEIDFAGAKRAGFKTVRILKGEFKKLAANKAIDFKIKRFNEILNIVG